MASSSAEPQRVVLTVFWCGTDGNRDLNITQIQMFGHWCEAADISDEGELITLPESVNGMVHMKIRFHGCAIIRGAMGLIFGAGLDDQCDIVRARLMELISVHRCKVVLNLLGLSRGGVACFKLMSKLLKFDPETLDVHLLSFDPVPGNFVASAKLDIFGITHAWGNMNLSKMPVLTSALVLYPYEPLPTLAVHAPMIPIFAPNVAVYDVILGCHQGAMYNYGSIHDHTQMLDTWISASIIRNFLISHGTLLDIESVDGCFQSNDTELLDRLEAENQQQTASSRVAHSYGSLEIVREYQPQQYLNKLHAILRKLHNEGELPTHWSRCNYFYATQPDADSTYTLHLSKEPS